MFFAFLFSFFTAYAVFLHIAFYVWNYYFSAGKNYFIFLQFIIAYNNINCLICYIMVT